MTAVLDAKTKETYLRDLKKKLKRYLRHESTVAFRIEEAYKRNLQVDSVLESKANFYDEEITKLQTEIKELERDMV